MRINVFLAVGALVAAPAPALAAPTTLECVAVRVNPQGVETRDEFTFLFDPELNRADVSHIWIAPWRPDAARETYVARVEVTPGRVMFSLWDGLLRGQRFIVDRQTLAFETPGLHGQRSGTCTVGQGASENRF